MLKVKLLAALLCSSIVLYSVGYAQQDTFQPNVSRRTNRQPSNNIQEIPGGQTSAEVSKLPVPGHQTLEDIAGCWSSDPVSDAEIPEYHMLSSAPQAWRDAAEGKVTLSSLLGGCGVMQWFQGHEHFCYRVVGKTVQIYNHQIGIDESPDHHLISNGVDELVYGPRSGLLVDNETTLFRIRMCNAFIVSKVVSMSTGHLSVDKNKLTVKSHAWMSFYFDGGPRDWIPYEEAEGVGVFDRDK